MFDYDTARIDLFQEMFQGGSESKNITEQKEQKEQKEHKEQTEQKEQKEPDKQQEKVKYCIIFVDDTDNKYSIMKNDEVQKDSKRNIYTSVKNRKSASTSNIKII
jgi:outer membrane biosynthesis protein TonB